MKHSRKTTTDIPKQGVYVLRLYVANDEQNSRLARQNLENICNQHLKDRCEIEEVDVLTDFNTALENRIFVTPTLVLMEPTPSVTIVGSLSDTDRVVSALRLKIGENAKKAR